MPGYERMQRLRIPPPVASVRQPSRSIDRRRSYFLAARFPFASEADPEGEHHQPYVEPEREAAHIQEVGAKLEARGRVLGEIDSGQSGQARPDAQSDREA